MKTIIDISDDNLRVTAADEDRGDDQVTDDYQRNNTHLNDTDGTN
jgi:hypothetical protein